MTYTNRQLLKLGVVVTLGVTLAWLIIPKTAKAKDREEHLTQKRNAMAVLETIRTAINDGIGNDDFEELKRQIQEDTGLRVYFNAKDNRYYVADATGKDILRS